MKRDLTPTEKQDAQFVKTQATILYNRLNQDEGEGHRPKRMKEAIFHLKNVVNWALYAITDSGQLFEFNTFKKEETMEHPDGTALENSDGKTPGEALETSDGIAPGAALETSESVAPVMVGREDEEVKVYMAVKMIRAYPEPKNGKEGYHIIYPDGYESWSPKAQFESACLPLEGATAIMEEDVEHFLKRIGAKIYPYKWFQNALHANLCFVLQWAKYGLKSN